MLPTFLSFLFSSSFCFASCPRLFRMIILRVCHLLFVRSDILVAQSLDHKRFGTTHCPKGRPRARRGSCTDARGQVPKREPTSKIVRQQKRWSGVLLVPVGCGLDKRQEARLELRGLVFEAIGHNISREGFSASVTMIRAFSKQRRITHTLKNRKKDFLV